MEEQSKFNELKGFHADILRSLYKERTPEWKEYIAGLFGLLFVEALSSEYEEIKILYVDLKQRHMLDNRFSFYSKSPKVYRIFWDDFSITVNSFHAFVLQRFGRLPDQLNLNTASLDEIREFILV